MILLLLLSLFLLDYCNLQLVYGLAPRYTLINCTWPCSNPTDICIVTTSNASCRPLTDNNSWIMTSPDKAPIYTGPTVTRSFQACIQVPIPLLPVIVSNQTNTTINGGQSMISWPIIGNMTTKRVQDDYLGNCGRTLYCHNSICFNRLNRGSSCKSSNQCAHGYCDSNGICRLLTNDRHHGNGTVTAVIVIASVFGVVGASVFAGLIYGYRKTLFKRILKKQTIAAKTSKQNDLIDRPPPPYEP